MKRIYIAAPFFNQAQVQLVEQIEALFDRPDRRNVVECWSPRKHGPVLERRPSIPEEIQQVYDVNKKGINESDLLLAVLNYPLSNDMKLVLTKDGASAGVEISIPDSGVAWEIGYATAIGKPIVGLWVDAPKNLNPNVMLTGSCMGILRSLDTLDNFLPVVGSDLYDWKVRS